MLQSGATTLAERVAAEAKREFADHLRVAAREGAAFIDAYSRQYVTGKVGGNPRPSLVMHPKLRALARELVADAGVTETTRGRRG